MRKTWIATTSMLLLLMGPTPQAQADVFGGVCVLDLTFEFHSPIGTSTAPTNPGYDIVGVGAADITDPEEPCLIPFAAPDIWKDTDITATGSSTIWTCESTVGGGGWNQTWGGELPSVFNATYWVNGTWGAWNVVILDTSPQIFTASIALTPHPDSKSKCKPGITDSIRMLGLMVLQDP